MVLRGVTEGGSSHPAENSTEIKSQNSFNAVPFTFLRLVVVDAAVPRQLGLLGYVALALRPVALLVVGAVDALISLGHATP